MSGNVTWHHGEVDPATRRRLLGHEGAVVWLTGLSGSGKSTVAARVERLLLEHSRPAAVLDGDNLRHGLTADLGFSETDRRENIRRVGEAALLLAAAGVVVLVPLISPYRSSRDSVRARAVTAGVRFLEVHVATPLEVCEHRDPKGLYARARSGELPGFTGIDDPYEAPLHPELVLGEGPVDEQALAVAALLD